ncbi:MAG: bifunctional phosphopantothenoylcysteine decarboxylase/phosphopantothenate--cysteine ligase CoaBC [Deltaproteobacteria bacterium]|nr:bifunctional phosphopantothenoylcysteine decarboxylase/phosphopantothenate--cysteine ligase CoaBC [Deltaproteobacteria bacterium]
MNLDLKNRKIILGVTGSIAAYKAPELARLLIKSGADVQAVITEAACNFVTPLTLETLTGHKVVYKMFNSTTDPLEHINLAKNADLLLIAPASADFIARAAAGRASDLLSAITLAYAGTVAFAPAMNTNMLNNRATQKNIKILTDEYGWNIIEPASGELACGITDKGRMESPETIVQSVTNFFNRDLEGHKIVITAGPTVEDIDPVRFISNRSSGKTGYAIARNAALRGARVVLISGPTALIPPENITVINVRSALEMRQAVLEESDDAHLVVMSAAVADFRHETIETKKIKKETQNDSLEIKLVKNPDILLEIGEKYKKSKSPVIFGFALETDNLLTNGKAKLEKKLADMIIANSAKDALEKETTKVIFIHKDGRVNETDEIPKQSLAKLILDEYLSINPLSV